MLGDSPRGREGPAAIPNANDDQLTHNVGQIGFQHGSEAKPQISRCIDFYADLFVKTAKKNWHEVRALAMMFEPTIRKNWPAYLEEMEGR
jgi:hypothetical protein